MSPRSIDCSWEGEGGFWLVEYKIGTRDLPVHQLDSKMSEDEDERW